ncbi:MAG: hypothetical protein RR681_03310 [Lachnospiraceae bacterium]
MNDEAAVRTKEGKLVGYKCINEGLKMLGIISAKGEYIGGITADDLYVKLNEGPYINIENQKNKL